MFAADMVTPEHINFMATHARGLICLAMDDAMIDRLELPMMVRDNRASLGTAFTVSIEARHGVSTGISARDRATTIRTAIADNASPAHVVSPGHVFPLRARKGGVLVRTGQTEGSVDLARLAGCRPAGVICEIMRDDGEMARRPELEEFAAAPRPAAAQRRGSDRVPPAARADRAAPGHRRAAARRARAGRAVRGALLRHRGRGHRVPRAGARRRRRGRGGRPGGAGPGRGDGPARRSVHAAAGPARRGRGDRPGRGRRPALRRQPQPDPARAVVRAAGPAADGRARCREDPQRLQRGAPRLRPGRAGARRSRAEADPADDVERSEDRRAGGLRHRGRRARAGPAGALPCGGAKRSSSGADGVYLPGMPQLIEGHLSAARPPVRDRREPVQRADRRAADRRGARRHRAVGRRRRGGDHRPLPGRLGAAAGRAQAGRARRRSTP